jgi:hypothetical protein
MRSKGLIEQFKNNCLAGTLFSGKIEGFCIQDELTFVPNDIARPEEDYGNMATPKALDADDIVADETLDKYLNAELTFDVGTGNERKGQVVKRAKGAYGKPIGCAHLNPLFDTHEYVVEFTDGSTESYFANIIAGYIYTKVDSVGNQYQLLSEIIDHRSDNLQYKLRMAL